MDADATNDSAAASASCIQRGWVLTGGFLNLPLGIPAVEVPVPNSQESRVFVSLRTTHRGLARWASNRPLNENVLAGSATFQAIREKSWQAVVSASARPANGNAEGEDPAAELGLELRKKKTNNFSKTALKKWAMTPPTLQVELNGWRFRVLTPFFQKRLRHNGGHGVQP